MSKIERVHAREILDSRGNPTVEVDVFLEGGVMGRAGVPSGASTGDREAVELRDGDTNRYFGKGVLQAVKNVNEVIAPVVVGMDAEKQEELDQKMIALDGTANKEVLGANAILGVSMAVARASATQQKKSLYRYLGGEEATLLPTPCFNSMNGGAHADNTLDFQEFKFVPVGANSFSEALQMGSEVYHTLKGLLKEKGLSTGVGDEGGFAPNVSSNEEAIELMVTSIEKAGYRIREDIAIGLDPAVSEMWRDGEYEFFKSDKRRISTAQMIDLWERWVTDYPIISIEDALGEKDWEGWQEITKRLGSKIQLVGDDLFCTNPKIIVRAIEDAVANASLIKLNQIGSVTEAQEAVRVSQEGGYTVYVSHRSGETADDFIADFSVAVGAGQIKTGAPCRGERMSKYNQLLRIEEELGDRAHYAGWKNFLK